MRSIVQMEEDKRLREAVLGQLWSQGISVRAKDGMVALSGVVHSYEEKLAAGNTAKTVYGAKLVANYITVVPLARRHAETAADATGSHFGFRPEPTSGAGGKLPAVAAVMKKTAGA